MAYYGVPDIHFNSDDSGSSGSAMTRIMGFSVFATLFQSLIGGGKANGIGNDLGGLNGALVNSLRLLILGAIAETGRRFFNWAIERFRLFQYSITAEFQEGDPSYEWLVLLLTEEKVWTRSRQFRVNATNSTRKWTVNISDPDSKDTSRDANAEYVPTYEEPQLFKWRGYWVEIRRTAGTRYNPALGNQPSVALYVTLYTRNMSALSAFVDDAKSRYLKKSTPHVIVHSIDQVRRPSMSFGHQGVWGNSKRKQRRPLSSIILQDGVIHSLVQDAQEFLQSEDWYTKAGIPHRRGYLLHGPPGTGKSSTIYAVAGELGLEIYSLSLASGFIDDTFLQRAVSAVPKNAIFLIEDIDCAFPSREDLEDSDNLSFLEPPNSGPHTNMVMAGRAGARQTAPITLSGLLNVLDGVGSEEGKIFFATTNYIDRLDSALLRPGRIDKKIQYQLATQAQAAALFIRFYPESYTTLASEKITQDNITSQDSEKTPANDNNGTRRQRKLTPAEKEKVLTTFSEQFASYVPEHEFSTAELQGFLLSCKQQPEKAVDEIAVWVATEKREREEKQLREEERRAKIRDKKEMREAKQLHGSLARLGNLSALGGVGDSFTMSPGTQSLSGAAVTPSLPQAPTASVQNNSPRTNARIENGIKPVLNGIAKSVIPAESVPEPTTTNVGAE